MKTKQGLSLVNHDYYINHIFYTVFAANASHCFLSYTSGPKIGDVSAPFDSFSDPIYGVDGLSMLAQLTFKVLSKTNELFSISKMLTRLGLNEFL